MGPQARARTLVKPTFKTKERWHEEFFINPLACLSSHFCWVLNFVVLNFHPILQTCHKAKFRRIFPKPSFDMICLLRISSCREKWVSRNDLSWFGEDPSRSRSYLLILWLASLCSALKIAKNWRRFLPDGHTLYDKYLHSVHQVNLHLLLNEICPPTEVSSCHFWGGILVTENAVGGLFFFLYTQVHTNKPSWQNSHVFFQQGFRLKLLPIFSEMKKETAGT